MTVFKKNSSGIKSVLHAKAIELGFCDMRVTRPQIATPSNLDAWLDAGYHGDMSWMEGRKEQRSSPQVLWSEVKSVIMLGFNYGPDVDPLEILNHKTKGAISVYARNRDYHDIIKGKLKLLAQALVGMGGVKGNLSYPSPALSGTLSRKGRGTQAKDLVDVLSNPSSVLRTPSPSRGEGKSVSFDSSNHQVKVFVDTAPVLEKPLAAQAGLGWQGKHTVLVSRDFGNWMFLGAIYTTLELAFDEPEPDHCGSCRKCLDICPTNAFPAPYVLDSRRCISYLTIELKTQIPLEFRKSIGNRIYGCDDCLAVCPWNKFAVAASEAKLQARADLISPHLSELATLDDAGFRQKFSGSPIKRIGRDRFIRNVLVAIGNSEKPDLLRVVEPLLVDSSELVREMAEWARGELEI
jgi:epoxyqueuosine reductase